MKERLRTLTLESNYFNGKKEQKRTVTFDWDHDNSSYLVEVTGKKHFHQKYYFDKPCNSIESIQQLFSEFRIESNLKNDSLLVTEYGFICGYQMIVAIDEKTTRSTLIKLDIDGTGGDWIKVFEDFEALYIEVYDFLTMHCTYAIND